MLSQELRRGAIGRFNDLRIGASQAVFGAWDAEELMLDFMFLEFRRHHG